MAFFKFRKGGDEQPTPPTAAESVEVMRRRARHRLIGAAVLVLLGVIGFPLLFDSQPRPIAVDIPIEIPDKAKVAPLPVPAVVATAPQSSGGVIAGAAPVVAAVRSVASASSVGSKPVVEEVLQSAPSPAPVSVPKPAAKAESKLTAKSATPAKSISNPPTSAKPTSTPAKPADTKTPAALGRFVVQVGAYSETAKAHEARMKVERAGFKTYTQVVGGKDSQRIRVRVGPFATKADAQKAADKLKKLSLPAAILEL